MFKSIKFVNEKCKYSQTEQNWVFSRSHCKQFFYETNLESPLPLQDGIKKKPRGKGFLQEAIVTAGGSRSVLQTQTAYDDFLKKPTKPFWHLSTYDTLYFCLLLLKYTTTTF